MYDESAMAGGRPRKKARLIYLDLCVLKRLFDEESPGRIRLEAEAVVDILGAAEQGQLRIVRSAALEEENALNPVGWRMRETAHTTASFGPVRPTTEKVVELAREFVAKGLGAMDALHVASAIDAGAEVFVTVDRRLQNAVKRLRLSIRAADPVDIAWEEHNEAP